MSVENLLFEISDALRVPVLALAVLCLAVTVVELGALLAEASKRRRRDLARLEAAVDAALAFVAAGQPMQAMQALRAIAWSPAMEQACTAIVQQVGQPEADARVAKRLAEYEYRSLRRLERTRILVRLGPALGLMGTLIPLSPALAGLAGGDVAELSENLRVAFSVTVAGLLVGALAFAISLTRDRLYAQDYSDVEYVAARLSAQRSQGTSGSAAPSPNELGLVAR